jgi:uncharacterized protein (DUF1778 family)
MKGVPMASTTLSIRLSQDEKDFIRSYAELNRKSVATVVLESVMDRIEDDFDLKLYEQAKAQFEADPTTYTLDEVERELGLG